MGLITIWGRLPRTDGATAANVCLFLVIIYSECVATLDTIHPVHLI